MNSSRKNKVIKLGCKFCKKFLQNGYVVTGDTETPAMRQLSYTAKGVEDYWYLKNTQRNFRETCSKRYLLLLNNNN